MQQPIDAVRRLSLWQVTALLSGWNQAQQGEDAEKDIDVEDWSALDALLDQKPAWMH